ncbi:hypothetical protein G3I21_07900 [Streptomyces bauhiniae]|uniref:Uncharacterized protein n=1 Tax=Streptomyces bauhiniae TaxID=2340725 RepID=A0A7K3QP17_9ACTN|nr:hypothetical protein [Streptomyces bauhiniae]
MSLAAGVLGAGVFLGAVPGVSCAGALGRATVRGVESAGAPVGAESVVARR